MARLDDLIDELRDHGRDDDADELEQLRGSSLRKKAAKADEYEAQVAELKVRLQEMELAPKRESALREYGVVLEDLRPAEREVLSTLKGELTPEAIGELVEKYGLPVGEVQGDLGEEQPAAAQVARVAQKAPRGRQAPTLAPGDVEEWPTEKLLKFKQQNPEEFEALKRGETVTGVSF